jgi:hypothetical protein
MNGLVICLKQTRKLNCGSFLLSRVFFLLLFPIAFWGFVNVPGDAVPSNNPFNEEVSGDPASKACLLVLMPHPQLRPPEWQEMNTMLLPSLRQHYPFQSDLVLLHENFSDFHQNHVVSALKGTKLNLIFVNIEPLFVVNKEQASLKAVSCHGFTMGYKLMCLFFIQKVWDLSALKGYRYYLRLDSDSSFSSPRVDLLRWFPTTLAVYGYLNLQYDAAPCVEGLAQSLCDFLRKSEAKPWFRKIVRWGSPFASATCESYNHQIYYTNFELVDMDFFRTEHYRQYAKHLERGMFLHRWGDAPVRAVYINLFAADSQVLCLAGLLSYAHQGHRANCKPNYVIAIR